MFQAGSGVMTSLLGIPYFLLYFAVGAAIMALFVVVYIRVTRHDELALIRAGNFTASIALSGTIIGFAIPLSKALAQAVSIPDLLVWAFAAFIIQLLTYGILRLLMRDLTKMIESNTVAAGVLLAAGSIASGMVNAAAMSL